MRNKKIITLELAMMTLSIALAVMFGVRVGLSLFLGFVVGDLFFTFNGTDRKGGS